MPFKKGHSGNIKGKPKGAKSKKTIQWEILGESIMNEHTEKFNAELSKLNGEKFMDMYVKVLEYFKPKQNRTDITTGGEKINPPTIKFFDTDK
jgi:hypothetical protein